MTLTIIPADEPEAVKIGKVATPLKAIRAKCLDCQAGSWKLTAECQTKACSLWPYREGTNPSRKGIGGNPEWKKKKTT